MALEIVFKKLEVVPLSKLPAKVLVRWEINAAGADLADYDFIVESAEAPDNIPGFQHIDIYKNPLPTTEHAVTANFEIISKPINGLDQLFFVDYRPNLINLTKAYNYRVKCTRKSTQEVFYSAMIAIDGELDLIGIYIAEETNFDLEDNATPSLLYNRKRAGVRCTKCFDAIQKKRLLSGCTTCFDTGWVGGFYDPIDLFVDFAPNPKNVQIAQFGEVQDNQSRLRMSNFPGVFPGDIIRELLSSRMWRVERVDLTERMRSTNLQWPVVTEIKPGDVEYKIPVDEQLLLAKVGELQKRKRKREF